MKFNIKLFFTLLVFVVILTAGIIFAGPLTPDNSPDHTGYTLEDLHNLINNTTTTEASHDFTPASTPTATTSYSTSEIYAELANLIKGENLETGVTYLGVTGFNHNSGANPATTTGIASSLTPNTPQDDSNSYSLEDIWNLIDQNTTTTPSSHDFTPTGLPSPSMHSISEIYTRLTDLIDPIDVKSGTTYLAKPGTSTCGDIPVGAATVISNCDNPITTPGDYILTDNLNCSLKVNSNDVNINGNYCKVDNVDASGPSDYSYDSLDGYSLTLVKIITNVIASNGAHFDSYGTGNGGNITISDSVFSAVNSYGIKSGGYDARGGGNGGVITIINSSGFSLADAHGGIGAYGQDSNGGNGGTINIIHSKPTSDFIYNVSAGAAGDNGNGGICQGNETYFHPECANEETCNSVCNSTWLTKGNDGSINITP